MYGGTYFGEATFAGLPAETGRVTTWGTDNLGESGAGYDGALNNFPFAQEILHATNVVGIDSGFRKTILLKEDAPGVRRVFLSGGQLYGTSAHDDNIDRVEMVEALHQTGLKILTMSCRGASLRVLLENGEVLGAGSNLGMPLGIASEQQRARLTPVETAPETPITGVTQVHCNHNSAYYLKSDGTVWRSGTRSVIINPYAALEKGFAVSEQTGTKSKVVAVVGSLKFLFVLLENGEVRVKGDNGYGEQGLGYFGKDPGLSEGASEQVVHNPGLTGVKAIACAEYHLLALKTDGTVWAWGRNMRGEVGITPTVPATESALATPTQVAGLTSGGENIAIAAGGEEFHGNQTVGTWYSMVLKKEGTAQTVWMFGGNDEGELCQGPPLGPLTLSTTTPVQINGIPGGAANNDIDMMAAGGSHPVVHHKTGTARTESPLRVTPVSGGLKVDWTPDPGDVVESWSVAWRRLEPNPYTNKQENWEETEASEGIAHGTHTFTITGLPTKWVSGAEETPSSGVFEIRVQSNYATASPAASYGEEAPAGSRIYKITWTDEPGPIGLPEGERVQEPGWIVKWRRTELHEGKKEAWNEAEVAKSGTIGEARSFVTPEKLGSVVGTTLLMGDATTTYSVAATVAAGRQEAFQFSPKTTGLIQECQFRTNGVENTGMTSLKLGIFADNAGKPGKPLGEGTFTGTPAINGWITVTGLSVWVAEGTKYWLVALPIGGSLHFNAAVASGGTGNVRSEAAGLTTLTEEAAWEAVGKGPVGFQAIGEEAAVEVAVNLNHLGVLPRTMWGGTRYLHFCEPLGATGIPYKNEPPVIAEPAYLHPGTTLSIESPATWYTEGTINPELTKYQWYRSVKQEGELIPIEKATSPTYGIQTSDIGFALRVDEFVTNGVGPATVRVGTNVSQPTRVVRPLPLIGDPTELYENVVKVKVGHIEAFQVTAKTSATVEELQLRTAKGPVNFTITSLVLAIMEDNAGTPGKVISQGTVFGTEGAGKIIPINTWVAVTGLSAPVVEGTAYWLAVLPIGNTGKFLTINVAGAQGNNVRSTAATFTVIEPFAAETLNEGGVGFYSPSTAGGKLPPVGVSSSTFATILAEVSTATIAAGQACVVQALAAGCTVAAESSTVTVLPLQAGCQPLEEAS